MAVESKIRELLRGQPEVVTEEVNELDEGSASRPADKTEGDSFPPCAYSKAWNRKGRPAPGIARGPPGPFRSSW